MAVFQYGSQQIKYQTSMKYLIVALFLVASRVNAQSSLDNVFVDSILTGTADGGAIITVIGADNNYTIPITANVIENLRLSSEMIVHMVRNVQLLYYAVGNKIVPVEIEYENAASPTLGWKIKTCYDRSYTFDIDEYTNAMEVLTTIKQFYLILLRIKLGMS